MLVQGFCVEVLKIQSNQEYFAHVLGVKVVRSLQPVEFLDPIYSVLSNYIPMLDIILQLEKEPVYNRCDKHDIVKTKEKFCDTSCQV